MSGLLCELDPYFNMRFKLATIRTTSKLSRLQAKSRKHHYS